MSTPSLSIAPQSSNRSKMEPPREPESGKDDTQKPTSSPKAQKSNGPAKRGKKVVGAVKFGLRKLSSKLLDLAPSARTNKKRPGLDNSQDTNTAVLPPAGSSSSSAPGRVIDDLPDELLHNVLTFLTGPELVRNLPKDIFISFLPRFPFVQLFRRLFRLVAHSCLLRRRCSRQMFFCVVPSRRISNSSL